MADWFDYKGYRVEIEQDESPEDPRNMDQFGHMICWHRRYNLGDKHSWSNPNDFENEILNSQKEMNTTKSDVIALPLYLYDHSGITMSTGPFNCPWDSGQVGWIYLTKAEILDNWNWKRLTKKRIEHVIETLKSIVKWYDDYLTGNVYCYVVSHPIIGEHLDSCCGIYGDPDSEGGAIEQAKESIDFLVEFEQGMQDWWFNNAAL